MALPSQPGGPIRPVNAAAPPRGGAAALEGFHYQLDVSILAALELLLVKKLASHITLEPANEEDLEADLQPAVPGRVSSSAAIGGYRLIVQTKLRSTGPWQIQDFEALLQHGVQRPPASAQLETPTNRYLLVTSADVSGVLRDLMVGDFGEWPDTGRFPAHLRTVLPPAPEGRVAIWAGATAWVIDRMIREHLGDFLGIAHDRLDRCRGRLREEASIRMRGNRPGIWTRADLIGLIREHGGYLASAPELETFVEPANWDVLLGRLERDHAVVIAGPSGTGKTLTALALIATLQRRIPELRVDTVVADPASTRTVVHTGPTLFYIEDPWGQYSLRGGSEAWTDQLPRMLRDARGDRMFVVTSRSDMLGLARADTNLKRWSVLLDADQYDGAPLARIYDLRLNGLAVGLQGRADRFRARALEALETPLEIDQFFDHFAVGPEDGEVDEAFYRRILDLSHRDAIEGVVLHQAEAIDSVGWTAIVWALLATSSGFDRARLVDIQRALRSDRAFEDGLDRFVNTLVAARHLRQPESAISFAHPSVRAGLEEAMRAQPGRSCRAIELLVVSLSGLTGTARGWGLETAALVIRAARRENYLNFVAPADAMVAIDPWLAEGLVDPQSDFRALLQLSADVGAPANPPAELARWFVLGVRHGGDFFNDDWVAPTYPDAWYTAIAADRRSRIISERFIRDILPHERDSYGADFLELLDRIAPDLTGAFIDAALSATGGGFDNNYETIAAGALGDAHGYEAVVTASLDEVSASSRQWRETGLARKLEVENGEFDQAYEEHWEESYQEDGYAAGVFLRAYVEHMRDREGWLALATHPRGAELSWWWSGALLGKDAVSEPDELRALLALARADDVEARAWDAVRRQWSADLEADLIQRICECPADQDLRDALAQILAGVSPRLIAVCLTESALPPHECVMIVHDLSRTDTARDEASGRVVVEEAVAPAGSAMVELFHAFLAPAGAAGELSADARASVVAAVPYVSDLVLGRLIDVQLANGVHDGIAVQRLLTIATDAAVARRAVEAAAAIGWADGLELSLGSRFADARQVAMEALCRDATTPFPPSILALREDKGHRVRRSLVAQLRAHPHPDHVASLIHLLGDRWSDAEPYREEPASYPIARAAAAALTDYGPLDAGICDALVGTADRTEDRSLGIEALKVAANFGPPGAQEAIWTLASDPEPRWVRVDAIDALTAAASVAPAILEAITPRFLLRAPAPIAASAMVLLATHGELDKAVEALERVAQAPMHRALLLVGIRRLAVRDPDTAARLLTMLPDGHPGRRLLELEAGERLPHNVLDDLGHIRIRNAAAVWLKDVIGTGPAV